MQNACKMAELVLQGQAALSTSPPCAQAFDELLLLRRSGQAIFFGPLGGPGAPALVSYLQALPGVPPITQG